VGLHQPAQALLAVDLQEGKRELYYVFPVLRIRIRLFKLARSSSGSYPIRYKTCTNFSQQEIFGLKVF
jgi:hypothetical protein